MSKTARLKLPLLHNGQAQKEITHNEALTILDVLVNPVVQEVNVDTTPAGAKTGDLYIVGQNPEGKFAKHQNEIAAKLEHGWQYVKPFKWFEIILDSDGSRFRFDGNNWIASNNSAVASQQVHPPLNQTHSNYLIKHDSGEYLQVMHLEEELTVKGKFTETIIKIPHHSIVIAVNTRVITAISGTNSFGVGAAGDKVRYGNNIGISINTTNLGLTDHLQTYWQDTPITLTANSGSFTGGKIKVTVQLLKPHGCWDWD